MDPCPSAETSIRTATTSLSLVYIHMMLLLLENKAYGPRRKTNLNEESRNNNNNKSRLNRLSKNSYDKDGDNSIAYGARSSASLAASTTKVLDSTMSVDPVMRRIGKILEKKQELEEKYGGWKRKRGGHEYEMKYAILRRTFRFCC